MNLSCSSDAVVETGNPLLDEWTTEFGIPPFDKIETKHFEPAFMEAMKMHNQEIEAIVANESEPTFENTIVAMDNAGIKLYELNLIFGMLSSSDLDEEMQEIQNRMMPAIEKHYNSIMLNEALFERVKAVYQNRKSLNLDDVQLRLVEKNYNDFVRSGALLEGEAKERLMQINAELAE